MCHRELHFAHLFEAGYCLQLRQQIGHQEPQAGCRGGATTQNVGSRTAHGSDAHLMFKRRIDKRT